MLVLLFHCSGIVARMKGVEGHVGPFGFGYCGVDLFFPISGFIIAHVHWKDRGHPDTFFKYFWRRVRRVYPLYWVILVPMVVLGAGSRDTVTVAVDFLLLRRVTWTLTYELLFYAIFALSILHRGLGLLALVLWGSVSVFRLVFRVPGSSFEDFIFGAFTIEFLLGVLAARLAATVRLSWGFGVIGGLLLTCLAAIDHLVPDKDSFRLAYSFAAFPLIAALPYIRMGVPRLWVFLGDASYSIFLCQVPFLAAAARLSSRVSGLPWWPLTLISIAGANLFVGVVVYLAIERPLSKRCAPKAK